DAAKRRGMGNSFRAGSVSDGRRPTWTVANASGTERIDSSPVPTSTSPPGSMVLHPFAKIPLFDSYYEVGSMPFEKVDTQVDFPAQERAILAFWEQSQAFEKLRAKIRGKPRWSFLDGPITANNPM